MPQFGIVAHLAIAFVAAAALAIAANVIAEHGTLIIRTTDVLPVSEQVAARPRIVTPPPVQSEPVSVLVPQPPLRLAEADKLASSIDSFGRIVLNRVREPTPAWDDQLKTAHVELRDCTVAYVGAASGVAERRRLKELTAQVAAHEARAGELVRLADLRGKQLASVWERFGNLETQTKDSLDRAWKIFGRVITRQSVLDLGHRVDALRRDLGPLANLGKYHEADVAAVTASETAFASALQNASPGLARSQGPDWLKRMQMNFETLVAARQSLLRTDETLRAALADFPSANTQLRSIADASEARRRVIAKQLASRAKVTSNAAAAKTAPLPVAQKAIATGHGPVKFRATAPEQTPKVSSTREANASLRSFMGWISTAVLLLLAAVCCNIFVRIVGPVRRLMHATRRVADGEPNVRVRNGGIKELDALAGSFNQMAECVDSARRITQDYQKELESKVEERTRQLQHLAERDPLTELPNRRQLFSELGVALQEAVARGHNVGVLILDLDNFKTINDSMGHAFGDQLLQSIAKRLEAIAAPFGFSARLGGDEFTVVLEQAKSVEEIVAAGLAIVREFQKPLQIESREVCMSLSIGAACFPTHAQNAEALLRAADAALFRAKALGRNQVSVFSPELLDAAAERFKTEQGLRQAIERGEFELAFQPELHVQSLEVRLVEALLRWRLPDGRLASTADFLAVAEESGLIREISDWVLRSAIEMAACWHHGAWPSARVAINVSARQLMDTRFAERVAALLRQHRLPANCIEIELTENVLQTGAATIEALRQLRGLGIGIALDDFGAGYSSLSSLEQLPLTRVKLDRSLIASIDSSPRARAIAQAIIGLCASLDLDVTAEGLERPEQLAPFLNHPNMFLQGYLLSRPVPAAELPDVMARMAGHMQSVLLSMPVPPSPIDTGEFVEPPAELIARLA